MTLLRVQKEQAALTRARFDHKAHVLQKRCLECHTAIPIFEGSRPPEGVRDHAGVRNIPGITVCRDCHMPDRVKSRCTSCHDFHPDSGRHAQLLRYVE